MTTGPQPGLLTEQEIRFGVANAAVVGALFAGAAARLAPIPTAVLVAAVVATAAVTLSAPWGTAVGLVGWAFYTGFVEHRYGVLTFAPGDLLRLVLLVAVGALVSTSTGRARPVHRNVEPGHE